MYTNRRGLYEELEKKRGSKLLIYVTGDRGGLETQISSEMIELFADHLDLFADKNGKFPKKISLWIYSRGGNTLSGWNIVNLIRQYCDEFEVIIFSKAQSTATLISLGADQIVMTKQAILGPIDPSINHPLNPPTPGAQVQVRVPVSVESIAGFIELAKKEFGIKNPSNLTDIFLKLSQEVHPIALGNVFRSKTQIQMLANKLLLKHKIVIEEKVRKKLISVLCSESGSHDYTISRTEARELGLKVQKPDTELYKLLKQIHNDIKDELSLDRPYDPMRHLGGAQSLQYLFKRCILESVDGGSHKFISEGMLTKCTVSGQEAYRDNRTFEGWREDK